MPFWTTFFVLFFFYATDIFWSETKWNNYFFFLICCKNQEKKKLDTKEFFLRKQQEMKISEGYNLINGAKLWYQMMRTSWSRGHATHTQRHQFLESQENQVWYKCDTKITCTKTPTLLETETPTQRILIREREV
jgi:hypothetical protein